MKRVKYILLFVLILSGISVVPQQQVDKELLKTANALFDNEEYLDALDIFRQLLSVSPEDHHLNFKYGACLIYSDEDTQEPIKYLKYGASDGSEPLSYYFLGKALHLNYQFADAQKAFSSFISNADGKLQEEYNDAELLLEMTKNGQTLLSKVKDIIVLDKTETSEKEFFRSYNLGDIEGRIIVTPTELKSKKDKESGENSLIYFQGAASDIYYSSYGNEDQRDIYRVSRLDNGKFTKAIKLSGGINTDYDENYPYMHPDGVTLYFSSKGHNSMGGYDIFKSTLDPNTGAFGPAENLDFAVSSPDDDLFYIADLNKENAYFASGRSSEQGRLNVYHVKVKAGVSNLVVIKGNYLAGDDNKPVRIRIEDAMTNNDIGAFVSDPETGEYLITLPRSGKYKFYVEEEGENTVHSGLFEIPRTVGNVAYGQEMTFTKMNGTNQLVLNNLFDKPLDDDITMLMADALRQKAQLDVNKDEFVEEIENDTPSLDLAYEQAGFSRTESNESIIAGVKSNRDSYVEESKKDITDAQMLYAYAQMKKDKAKDYMASAKDSFEKAKIENDQSKKEEYLLESAYNKKLAEEENQDASNAIGMLKMLDKSSKTKHDRYVALEKNLVNIESSIQENNYNKLVDALTKQKEINSNEELPSTLELLQEQSNEKRRQSSRALEFAQKLEEEEKVLNDKLVVNEKRLESTTKKKDREIIEQEIISIKDELADYEVQTEAANKRYETRILDQSKSEAKGELLSSYTLRREGDIWSELEPTEYSSQELTEFEKDMRIAKRESKEIEIDSVEIAQLLAKREDLSHKFDFGEVVRGNEEIGVTGEVEVVFGADELEFVEDEEDPRDLIVISQNIEKEDDYKMFLIETDEGNDKVNAYDSKIAEYNEALEDASADEKEILESRINSLTTLKSERITEIENEVKANLMADFSDEIKTISEKEFQNEQDTDVYNWISPSYITSRDEILNSDMPIEEKQQKYDELNTSFGESISKSKAELMYLYTIREIAGTVKAKKNLDYLESMEIEFANKKSLALENEVVDAANSETTDFEDISVNDITSEEELSNTSNNNVVEEDVVNFDDLPNDIDEDVTLENTLEDSVNESLNEIDATTQSEEAAEVIIGSDVGETLIDDTSDVVEGSDIIDDSNIQSEAIRTDANDIDAAKSESDLSEIDSEIIIQESNILNEVERRDLAELANITVKSQENFTTLSNIESGTQMGSEKAQGRIDANSLYLDYLESKKLDYLSNNSDAELILDDVASRNDAIDKLILSTKVELDRDRLMLARSNDVEFTQKELSNAKYRTDYIEELAKISGDQSEESQKIKSKVMLNNMVAFDLEKEIQITKAQLSRDDISQNERAFLEGELVTMENDYSQIRESNSLEIAQLDSDITEEEMYNRQKFVSYSATDERDSDYTDIVKDLGYTKAKLNNNEARILQEEANKELIILESQESVIDEQTYIERETAIGEKMTEANRLEIESMNMAIANVNTDEIADRSLAAKVESLMSKAETWNSSARNLEQLSINAVGTQKNDLLKDKLTSQLNAIEYTRHAQAIVNYSNNSDSSNESFVFTDFVVPNHQISELNDKPDYDLADDLFSSNYQAPSYSDEELVNEDIVNASESVEGEVIKDVDSTQDERVDEIDLTISDAASESDESSNENIDGSEEQTESLNTTDSSSDGNDTTVSIEDNSSDLAGSDSLELLNTTSLSEGDLEEAQIRLNKESVKQIQPINDNGVFLSADGTAELNNNPEANGESARAYFKKKGLIDQIKGMTVEQINLQSDYSDRLFTKEQGLVVVKESIEKDGTSDVLVKEHNRLVAEIARLKELDSIAKNNVLRMDSQLDQEETSLVLLERKWEEEKALSEFVIDNDLTIPSIPSVLERNVFVKSNNTNAAYADNNPIPVDPVMPDGVVYQVQVGAYRQPIPQDLFKGFAPIMGQKIHSGITRYKVGLFTSKSNATTARDEIRNLGYTDAFVVVYNNGEKITISEAQRLTGEEQVATTEATLDNGDSSESTSNISDTNIQDNGEGEAQVHGEDGNSTVGTGIEDLDDYSFVEDASKDDYYNDSSAAEAKQVEMIKGLFFTVQIGAYSNPVTADKLQNVSPLNSELTDNGLIRYTTGIYGDIEGASGYKQQIIDRGISDAFVSAYYNGFRINLSKARELISTYGNSVFVDESILQNGNVNSISREGESTNSNPINTSGSSQVNSDEDRPKDEVLDAAYSLIENGMPGQMIWDLLAEEGLLEDVEEEDNTFKVILGPFVEAIPTREVEIILNFRDNIRFEERENNAYVYSSINPITYDEARNLKETLEKEGITTAKIVSFKGDREISLKEFLDGLSE